MKENKLNFDILEQKVDLTTIYVIIAIILLLVFTYGVCTILCWKFYLVPSATIHREEQLPESDNAGALVVEYNPDYRRGENIYSNSN